ncbi:MAG TPA: VWA domain-containing protein [Thermoanaerobaculia bacterium]|nr:VWA domain-containing protein [Thermoanaerobaculia bacterium]
MRRRGRAPALAWRKWLKWLVCLGALALAAAAHPSDLAVEILSPRPEPVFGQVLFAVQVAGSPTAVELRLDGRLVATLTEPPWRAVVDAGDENRERRFEALARGAGGETATAVQVTPRLRVDEELSLDLQQLFVTVTRGGRRETALRRSDLRVFEDGDEQEVVTFETGDAPFTAVLLLDTSESMRGTRMEAALRGARDFAAGMKELDEAMLILFSDRVLRSVPFTASAARLAEGLAKVDAGGGTALNDHLYLALKLLDGRQGRRVVVVFSDGQDVVSGLSMRDVLWKTQRSQTAVYWLRLTTPGRTADTFSSAWRNGAANREEGRLLEDAVRQSGGRTVDITGIGEVEAAFRGILDELRAQYVVGYYPKDPRNDGSWRKVTVRLAGGGEVRVREGYVDY